MKTLIKLALAALLCVPAVANAGFEYTVIGESSSTDPSPPLTYGTPTISTVGPATIADFTPRNFAAISNGALGIIDITDGRLDLAITSTGGQPIEAITIEESGAYSLNGTNSMVSYGVTVVPTVTAIDGVATLINLDPISASGSEVATSDATTIGSWSETIELDIVAALAAKGITGSATAIEIALDNTLVGDAIADGLAFIDKKNFTVSAVPEPSSFLFLGVAAAGAVVWQKRRRDVITEDVVEGEEG